MADTNFEELPENFPAFVGNNSPMNYGKRVIVAANSDYDAITLPINHPGYHIDAYHTQVLFDVDKQVNYSVTVPEGYQGSDLVEMVVTTETRDGVFAQLSLEFINLTDRQITVRLPGEIGEYSIDGGTGRIFQGIVSGQNLWFTAGYDYRWANPPFNPGGGEELA